MRTFFAVDLPPQDKQHLAIAMNALRPYLQKVYKGAVFRWVKPDNLHLTLQFLGQVNEAVIEALLQQAYIELEGTPSFYLSLGPLEWFPNCYQPRVLSVKLGPQEILTKLSSALKKAAVASGCRVDERLFRAHLTLARIDHLVNAGPEILHTFSWPSFAEILVKEVVFFQSEPGSNGSVYTRLAGLSLLP